MKIAQQLLSKICSILSKIAFQVKLFCTRIVIAHQNIA